MRTMNVGLPGSRSNLRRRLATTILTWIVVLVAIYPVMRCAPLGDLPNAGATPAISPIATPEISPIVTSPATVVATPRATAPSQSQTSPWKLVWSDEFNGPRGAPPDANKWTPDIGGEGWGNQQLEYDTDNKNAYQDGQGHLV